jgi:superfamily II DNA/RNA helicase
MAAFVFYLREAVIPQLHAHFLNLASLSSDPSMQHRAQKYAQTLPKLKDFMVERADKLSRDGQLTRSVLHLATPCLNFRSERTQPQTKCAHCHVCSAPMVTSKTKRLMELVGELLTRNEGSPDFKGIIFVEQVALTVPLAHLLNRNLTERKIISVVDACSGSSSMATSKLTKILENFKRGSIQVWTRQGKLFRATTATCTHMLDGVLH